jgi:hypothetical protein
MTRIEQTAYNFVCVICKRQVTDQYGNNPDPVRPFGTGKCCNECNSVHVIPARVRNMREANKSK